MFQGFNLLSRTSAIDNVELPLLYRGGKAIKTSGVIAAHDALTARPAEEGDHPSESTVRRSAARVAMCEP